MVRLIQIIQANYKDPRTFPLQFREIFAHIIGISVLQIENILDFCTHQSTNLFGVRPDFPPFITELAEALDLPPLNARQSEPPSDFLQHLNLSNVDFSGEDFSGVNLSGVNLSRVNLSGVNLSGVNLSGADLSGMDLNGVKLRWANLSGANLSGTNLSKVDWECGNLSGADLRGANLSNMDLIGIDLRGANLNGANLCEANLCDADLRWANLSNANLCEAGLRGADLSNANLCGVDLSGADLSWADLSLSNLNDVKNMVFKVPTVEDEIDEFFNHLDNENRSDLTTIDSIPEAYLALKIQLMESVITQINNFEPTIKNLVLVHKNSLYDILCQKNTYLNSAIILDFIKKELVSDIISNANLNKKEFNSVEQELFFALTENEIQNKPFCLRNSGFICQLIYSLKTSENTIQQEKGLELEVFYLSHFPQVMEMTYAQLEEMGEYEEADALSLNKNMLLISSDEEHFIIVSYAYYQKFIMNLFIEAEINWDNIFYFKKEQELYSVQPYHALNFEIIFNKVQLFFAVYQFQCHLQKTLALLDSINLGVYAGVFREAFNAKTSQEKFGGTVKENALISIFRHCVQTDTNLAINSRGNESLNLKISSELHENIINIFQLNQPEISLTEKAQIFTCLAVIFTKLSSSSFFGTGLESPLPLRNMAIALLNKAAELDMTVVPNIVDWKNRLAGCDGAFTCTAVLYDIMSEQLELTSVFTKTIPPVWQ